MFTDSQKKIIKSNIESNTDKKEVQGAFYKSALMGDDPSYYAMKNKDVLGDLAEIGGIMKDFDGYTPSKMSADIVSKPFTENPLRPKITLTNITNLEIPKMIYTYDVEFVKDGETAKEMELSGELVTFGRHKIKTLALVGDTVVHGALPSLTQCIERGLRSSLASKEIKSMFRIDAPHDESHMSFYGVGIKPVSGLDLLDSIWAAYDDLEDIYKPNATVVMRSTDWIKFMREQFNKGAQLWSANPQDTIGLPVVFVEEAAQPIVGDLRFLHLNYHIGSVYETQRKAKEGMNYFAFTAWFDVQFLLKAAFRIAKDS